MQRTQRLGSTLDGRMASPLLSCKLVNANCVPLLLRSQITPCCQTQDACQNSSECAYRRGRKTPGTSPPSLTCLCSICQLTLCPKSSGENAIIDTLISHHYSFASLHRSTYFVSCSAYKQLNVKEEPLQLITPQFETPLPQLQPAVSYNPAFLFQPMFSIQIITSRHNFKSHIPRLLRSFHPF